MDLLSGIIGFAIGAVAAGAYSYLHYAKLASIAGKVSAVTKAV